ncbi:MAG TPA: site-specific integrase [Streptosporangiaceae bacterium]|nr:site-specific integrase [Streptosporangiaceae bacterium]
MMDISYNAAVSMYLTDAEKHRHLAASTLRVYRITLRDFARQDGMSSGYILLRDIPRSTWVAYMDDRAYMSNKGWNAVLSRLSAFVKWACAEGYLLTSAKSLGSLRERPNTTLRPKTFLLAEHLPAVLEKAGEWSPRDEAFLDALWWSRRRSGELSAVRVRDVDLEPYPDAPHGRMTWANQKAHRPHQCLDMNAELQRVIRDWLPVYESLAGEKPKPSWFLFPALRPDGLTVPGKRRRLVPVPESQIGQPDAIARRAFKAAGVYSEGMACHALRRGSADKLYDDAARAGHKNPLRVVMTALDHASEQMTENYLNRDRDKRDLAMLEHELYGGQAEQAEAVPAAAEQVIVQPAAPASGVVSMAAWKASKTG